MKKIILILLPLLLLFSLSAFAATVQRLTPAEINKIRTAYPNDRAEEMIKALEAGVPDFNPSPSDVTVSRGAVKGALNEGFENPPHVPPTGWAEVEAGATWYDSYWGGPHSGSHWVNGFSCSSGESAWLITPRLSIASGDSIIYWYRAESATYDQAFKVLVSTSATQTDTSSFIELWDSGYFNNTTYARGAISLSSYVGNQVYIGFKYYYSEASWYSFCLDDVSGPQIFVPGDDMATISIDNPSDGASFEGNSSVTIQATVQNVGSNAQNNVPVHLEITDGSKGVIHTDVEYTGSLNQDDTEQITFSPDWTVPDAWGSYTIKIWTALSGDLDPSNDTLSIGVTSTPEGVTCEDFEGTFPPDGWTVVNNDGGSYTWVKSSSKPYSGSYHAESRYETSTLRNDDWLITPKLVIDSGTDDAINFWYCSSLSDDSLEVWLSTSGNDPSDFTNLLWSTHITSSTYQQKIIDLDSYDGNNVYVAFVNKGLYLWRIRMDYVCMPTIWVPSIDVATTEIISPPPSVQVGVPVTPQAEVENKGGASADFWAKCTIDGYSDSAYVTGLSPGDVDTVSFPSWTPSSGGDYTVTVWTELSGDVDPTNDTLTTGVTVCAAYTIPFTENFDGDWGPDGDNPPACWTIIDNGDESPSTWNNNDWHRYSGKAEDLTQQWAEYEKLAQRYSTEEEIREAIAQGVLTLAEAEKVLAIGRDFYLKSGKKGYLARVYWSPVEQQDEWLITPVLDCPDTTLLLSFWMDYQDYSIDETDTGFVLLSTDGGVTWPHTIAMYAGEDITGDMAYDITSYARGESQVKIGFRYRAHDDMYWKVDDVEVFYPWYHDVGTVSIDSPVPLIFTNLYPVGEEMHIKATVQNYGHFTETFDVICYLNTEEVSYRVENLAPGEQSQITFNFTPPTEDTWTVTVHTALTGDMDNTNDDQTQSDLFVTQVAKSYPYFADFESKGAEDWEVGGWYGPPYDFEVGTPTYGPPGAYSGSNVWATVLDDDYSTSRAEVLISPLIDLTTADPAEITYTFQHWFHIETTWDGGLAFITWPDSTTMYFIEPEGGYPGYFYFNYYTFPGWTGSSPSYPGAYDGVSIIRSGGSYYDFSQAAGHIVRVGFLFSSDYSYTYEGWYLDYFDIYEPIPPTITVPADTAIDEGQALSFAVSATDPNYHESITLTAEDLPTGASFTQDKAASASGTFDWTPNYGQAGVYTVRFIATDLDDLADTDYVQITVNDVDQPPMITATYTQYAIYICEEPCIPTDIITAFDPDTLDGDDVILTVIDLPEHATFTLAKSNPQVGYLDWCPTPYQTDSAYVIRFEARGVHSKDLYDTLVVTITILPIHEVTLGEVQMVWPGDDFCIPVSISSQIDISGFNFLIHFDPSVLTITEVRPKYYHVDSDSFLLEYFNWSSWQVDDGQKLRIIGIANKPNDSDTPPVSAGCNQEVAEICFHVSAKWDCNYWLPIDWEVDDPCMDNTLSDALGESLYTAKWIISHKFTQGAEELDTIWVEPCMTTYCDEVYEKPGWMVYSGTRVECEHIYGSYGDINMDKIRYTIADAVYFMEYLKGKHTPLPDPEYQGTASDVNRDGHQWTIADLIFLVNIVNGSADPYGGEHYPKALASSATIAVRGNTVAVDAEIGGIYLRVKGGGEPMLRASGMMMETSVVNGERRILIIGADWETHTATGELVTIPGDFQIREVQVSDAAGYLMTAKVELIPTQFALHQNYPNPFNPNTNIAFDLPEDVEVSLTIYNTSGQKVAELMNGEVKAGHHTVTWNVTDVSSGVYFYRLTAGSFIAARKMVLMK
jgi:hypothetical protein